MKIKIKNMDYDKVINLKEAPVLMPKRPGAFFRWVMKIASLGELKKVKFKSQMINMNRLNKKEPCLILMNHSSFIDLKIASALFKDRPFNIVCTTDGFIGKKWLMRHLGCIPTNKFVTDSMLVRNMVYAIQELHNSVLMYPEAGYSFDGTATTIPDSIGKCIKFLKVPVILVHTKGAFQRDPLYNGLQIREVNVSADVEYLLSKDDITEKSTNEITALIRDRFTFDNFAWQKENKISIDEPFRADFLNRVLYKCPSCGVEGKMQGKGTSITCHNCGKQYDMNEYGELRATDGISEFTSVPDWFRWEREQVKEELQSKTYNMEVEVDIYIMKGLKCLYQVGEGILKHSTEGFKLTGCEGKLDFQMSPKNSYSLNADYFWYEIGDMICIGDNHILYYCFPKNCSDVVTKARLATEELYKLIKSQKNK